MGIDDRRSLEKIWPLALTASRRPSLSTRRSRRRTRLAMSNDRYQEIREALAMGPTPGPWIQDGDGVTADDENVAVAVCCPSDADAAFIAACEPDTIHELLEERDALRERVG